MKSKRNKFLDFVIDDIFRQITNTWRWNGDDIIIEKFVSVILPWELGFYTHFNVNDEFLTNDDVQYREKMNIQRKLYGMEFKEFVTERYGIEGQTYYEIILWGLANRITDKLYQ